MTAAIDRYFQDLPGFKEDWENHFTIPYVLAYNKACNSYKETIAAQAASDKTRAELFILAASILSGSVLMTVFATTSVRTILANRLLNTICNNNMEVTFKAFAWASNNRTAKFVLGAIADKTSEVVGDAAKEAASSLTAHQAPLERRDALEFDLIMRRFLGLNSACARKVAESIRDNRRLSDSRKDELIAELRSSYFHRPPQQNIIPVQTLADRIELSFYLTDLLDSDYTRTVTETASQWGPAVGRGPRRPIETMPSAGNYPVSHSESIPPLHNVRTGIEVGVRTPGGDVRKRTDDLHKSIFGTNFYPHQNFFERQVYESGRTDLRNAETRIGELAHRMRPLPVHPIAV